MSETRHLLLAWTLLASVVAAFATGLWLPALETLDANRQQIANVQNRIDKVALLANEQSTLKQELKQLRALSGGNDKQFIRAKSQALAAADLQRRVQEIINAHSARQISSQPTNTESSEVFNRLQVNVNLTGSIDSLQAILFELEREQPRMFIEQLLISSSASNRGRGRTTRSRAEPKDLSARLRVVAYMQDEANGDETN